MMILHPRRLFFRRCGRGSPESALYTLLAKISWRHRASLASKQMNHSPHLLAVVLFFAAVAALGSVDADEPAPVPPGVLLQPEDEFWEQPAPAVFRVRVTTSEGDFVMEVHRPWAPLGVDRFYNLVRAGFFDDSRFYRVRESYIAQFGISGDPSVSAVWRDLSMIDDPVRESNTRASFAFAMTGPDTRTTQIYINLADNTHLDSQGFTPLGRVVEGMEVVDRLYAGYDEGAGGGMRGENRERSSAGATPTLTRRSRN